MRGQLASAQRKRHSVVAYSLFGCGTAALVESNRLLIKFVGRHWLLVALLCILLVGVIWDWMTMLAAVLIVHIAMFWVAVRLAKTMGFSREDQITVGFSGSQQTLMVGLLVAVSLQITILPMVTYHIMQLVVDTVIADRYHQSNVTGITPA